MSESSESLTTFKKKIEEAVVLVPAMIAEEKLKAVQFWNVVSEKLQEIVNNSAADINALAMRMEETEQQQRLYDDLTDEAHQTLLLNHKIDKPTSQSSIASNHSLLDSIPSESSNDREELFLPMIGTHSSNNEIVDDMVSDNISASNFSETHDNSDDMDEHLATVITSYGTQSEHNSSQLLIAFEKTAKSNDLTTNILSTNIASHQLNSNNNISFDKNNVIDCNKTRSQTNIKSTFTSSVIQEVDQTSLRQNVIQSPQKSMQMSECNDITDKSDNEVIDDIRINNEENHEGNSDNSFNDTSFDLNYDSCDDIDVKIDDMVDSDDQFKNNVIKSMKKIRSKKKNKFQNNKCSPSRDSVECDVCHKLLPTHSALVTHKWIHSKPYECSECDARFSTKGNLLVHCRRHTGEKPFACVQCSASFSTKGNLKRHIKAHSGERPWLCSQCDSKFTEKKSLKVHMRRHTGEKPYQCNVCGKSFSQTGVLQTHMALHLDERKHLCELCGKAFRQRSQLRLHVLRHEGVKRWDCSDCDAKFLTKGDLERHHRVHTGERPFVCDLCGKTFTRQQSLNEHSNRHYGLKPYSCTVCSKTFAEMSACYKHIKVHKKQQSSQPFNGHLKESYKKIISDNSIESFAKNGNNDFLSDSDNSRSLNSGRSVIQSASTSSSLDKNFMNVGQLMSRANKSQANDNSEETSISDNNIACINDADMNLVANSSSILHNF